MLLRSTAIALGICILLTVQLFLSSFRLRAHLHQFVQDTYSGIAESPHKRISSTIRTRSEEDSGHPYISLTSGETTVECIQSSCHLQNVCIGPEMVSEVVQKRRASYTSHRFVIKLFGDNFSAAHELIWQHMGPRDAGNFVLGNMGNDTNQAKALLASQGEPRRAAVSGRYVPQNCGHTLLDDVLPLFRLVRLFHSATGQTMPLLNDLYLQTRFATCIELFHPLLTNDTNIHTIRSHLTRLQCFSDLYIGIRGLSLISEPPSVQNVTVLGPDLQSFRSQFYNYADSTNKLSPSQIARSNQILVLQKKRGHHMANFDNADEIVETLSRQLPSYKTRIISWSEVDLVAQLQLLQQTYAMISLPGAAVLNAVFLPDHSKLVLYCRVLLPPHNSNATHEMDNGHNDVDNILRYMPYVQTVRDEYCNSSSVLYDVTSRNTTLVNLTGLVKRLKEEWNFDGPVVGTFDD